MFAHPPHCPAARGRGAEAEPVAALVGPEVELTAGRGAGHVEPAAGPGVAHHERQRPVVPVQLHAGHQRLPAGHRVRVDWAPQTHTTHHIGSAGSATAVNIRSADILQ